MRYGFERKNVRNVKSMTVRCFAVAGSKIDHPFPRLFYAAKHLLRCLAIYDDVAELGEFLFGQKSLNILGTKPSLDEFRNFSY